MAALLLDANVLIPLVVTEHVHHEATTTWASGLRTFALCPVVEGALVRFLVRLGASGRLAQDVLRGVQARRGYEFWSDSVSYGDVDLSYVRGHRHVTDAYLVGLARSRRSKIATFDRGMAELFPKHAILVPS